jgi:hypothetical protein
LMSEILARAAIKVLHHEAGESVGQSVPGDRQVRDSTA